MKTRIILQAAARSNRAAEHFCKQYGHKCKEWIPLCHPRAKQITPILQASSTMQYLQCNWFVAQAAKMVLAFGYFDDAQQHVLGGTGWTVDMAIMEGKPTYVFDCAFGDWYMWHRGQFRQCEGMDELFIAPPHLQDMTAIVSTREMSPEALNRLRDLFDRHTQKHAPGLVLVCLPSPIETLFPHARIGMV